MADYDQFRGEMPRKRALILLSGGVDSTTALAWAIDKRYKLTAITINYYKRSPAEIRAVEQITSYFKIPLITVEADFLKEITDIGKDMKNLGEVAEILSEKRIPEGYIPMKNLLFISIAAYFAEVHRIPFLILGEIISDRGLYPDASPRYFSLIENLINMGGISFAENRVFSILLPFENMSKGDVIRLGFKLKVPYGYTWSCYGMENEPCGVCAGCIERAKGFEDAGFKDPLMEKLKTTMHERKE